VICSPNMAAFREYVLHSKPAMFPKMRTLISFLPSGGQVILPPTRTLALIEFLEPSEARRAFKHLAYTKFHHVPLYLEWTPLAIIGQKPEKDEPDDEEDEGEEEGEATTTSSSITG